MATEQAALEAARDLLSKAARSLLIGPLTADEVIESAPADTYLTGILWPRGTPIDGGDDDAGLDGSGDADSGADATVPGYRAIRPCSVGITFAVKVGSTVKVTLGDTSRYEPIEPPAIEDMPKVEAVKESRNGAGSPISRKDGGSDTKESRPRRVWARRHLGYSYIIEPNAEWTVKKISSFVGDDGSIVSDDRLSLHIKRRVDRGQHVLTVTLINEEDEEDDSGPRDARCLFQAGIVIHSSIDHSGSIQPRPRTPVGGDDEDTRSNALLYRDVREFAVGHGIATMWNEEVAGTVSEVRTAWMPETKVTGTSAKGHDTLDLFREKFPNALDAAYLGNESAKKEVIASLSLFSDCYADWVEKELKGKLEQFKSDKDLHDSAKLNLERCLDTLRRMRDGVATLEKQGFAWTSFALANAAMDAQSRYRAKGSNAGPLVWRPFQLAFMLLVIPGLIDPEARDRDCMDLLWFPTGGGKTEAYLALTAFQIFHRRFTDESRRFSGGVDVLMRYTLRLLTVQQFQRAASLISACESIRESDPRLGAARITLGLYVGGDATPNTMEAARAAIDEEHADQKPKSTPRQLLRCPVCGSELQAGDYHADPANPRIDVTCRQKDCEFGNKPLPVHTVDETIYAEPPSLLIGTIDKFAQIPRSSKIRSIFGLDGGLSPGLIIQDELHLISGPLGSMAGLYETVVDILCTRDGVRPKVIGSTATIGHAAEQVQSLFDRSVLQFPPPGFDAGDSFFAVRDSKGPDRLYIGIPTAGRSPKFALQALVAAILESAAALREKGQVTDETIDAYWTCVAYFNSLRELGGAYVLMQDDVPRQMQFLSGRLGAARRELQSLPVELSSRRSSRELPELLHALSSTLEHFAADPFEHEEPKNTVLASNMISVGVDVPRLGLMVVNGQPKSTAEYIQASSRVGRGIPGLVLTLYNFGRPRDLSHFEHFRVYHSALYRSVEATSVTPWAPRARDKALHAVIASLVRHLVPGLSGDDDAVRFDPKDPAVASLVNMVLGRISKTTDGLEFDDAKEDLVQVLNEWARRCAEARSTTWKLRYWEKRAPFGKSTPHLMRSAESGLSVGSLAWATPNTMREVEPSTAFVLKKIVPKRSDA